MNRLTAFDPLSIIAFITLAGFSLAIIASTNPSLFYSQAIFFILGIILFIFFSRIDYRIFKSLIGLIYILSVISLLVPFAQSPIRGAHRWVDLFGFRLQTSEIVKPFFFLVLSYILSRQKLFKISSFIVVTIAVIPIIFLIFKQPDLGNVIIYVSVFFLSLIAAGLPVKYIVGSLLVAGFILPSLWNHLADYQKLRIITFINPEADPAGAGYNALQSIIAIGSGGLLGLGMGHGTQSHLRFLPEFHTDFAFATLIEEFGLAVGIIILICYGILLLRLLFIARSTSDPFGRILVLAVFSQILTQAFINIGMNVGLLPITGITLPFISYGGSSILGLCIGLGLAFSVRNRKSGSVLVVSEVA